MDSRTHHHMGVRELDLSACHVNSLSDKINAVPGLRTSTAFFTFLRANLVLSASAMSSCANTPILEPATPTTYPPTYHHKHNNHRPGPSPLAANPPLTPLDDIPPLSLEPLSSPEEKAEGLNLVADSVAQMQQRASRAVATHPLCLAGLGVALAVVYRFSVPANPGLGLLLAGAVTASYVLAIRYFTSGYVDLAEQLRSSWLRRGPDSGVADDDLILGARYGDNLVGALVLRLQTDPARSTGPTGAHGHGRKRSRGSNSLRGGRGIIRAWTTRLKYRGTGVGRDLLASAVRLTKEKCGRDAEVGFAKEHANSTMLLPSRFNGLFRRDEIRAAKALDAAVAEWEANKKRR